MPSSSDTQRPFSASTIWPSVQETLCDAAEPLPPHGWTPAQSSAEPIAGVTTVEKARGAMTSAEPDRSVNRIRFVRAVMRIPRNIVARSESVHDECRQSFASRA
ncbi:hypothetical protein [Mycolicibacterium sediminis]|uniref:hypothetical protein n=1 Tax=Mycolicibacterium sediminis TaxID=1286180 RepID=UPI0013D0B2A3|nr:hypothetical protein [Mycolicibacterium sediminis]